MTALQSIRRRWVAIFALVIVLAGAGAYVIRGLPSAIFPSVTFPIVKVIVDVGEEPAARMMPTVTRPLEEAVHRVPGIQVVRSTTSRGSSELSTQFAWGTDMKVALQRVQSETQRILPDLPPDTRIDVEWMNPASFPIQGYALTSKTRSQAELLRLAEFTLKPELIRIPGVSRVEIQGGRKREFQVRLDPAAVEGRGLSVGDVVSAIQENNDVLSAGLTEENHELYLTLVDGRSHGLDDLSRLAVPVPGASPATLAELGTLEVADEVSYIRTTADGDSAVLVNLIRQPSANTVAIADGVRRLFRESPDLLPHDVRWTTFYDQARFVAASVNGTRDAILIGVVLAALVLLAFLGKVRLTLIAVLTIPFTAAIVGLALGALDQTVNLMTLAGVAAAIGLIADDAIVVVEMIEHEASENPHGDPAERGLDKILPALIGSSLSTTLILLPFALLTGVVGAFFRPLALTMAVALTVSFFLAWLWVPAAVGRFGIRRRHPSEAPPDEPAGGESAPEARKQAPEAGSLRARWRAITATLSRGYDGVAAFLVDYPLVAALVILGLIAGTAYTYRHIGTDFLPSMDEGSIILDYWTPPGTSLTETDRMLREAEKVIQEVPDVQSYSRRTGTQLGFFITEPNSGDYVINLKPRGTRRPVDEVIDDLRTRIAAVEPAISTDFGQLLEDNIGDLTGGTPQPIDVKIFGSDLQVLEDKARRAADIISGVPGVEDVFDGITIAGPALNIRVDTQAAGALRAHHPGRLPGPGAGGQRNGGGPGPGGRPGLRSSRPGAGGPPPFRSPHPGQRPAVDPGAALRAGQDHHRAARGRDRPGEPPHLLRRDRPPLRPEPGGGDRGHPARAGPKAPAPRRHVHPVRGSLPAAAGVVPTPALRAPGRAGPGGGGAALRVRGLAGAAGDRVLRGGGPGRGAGGAPGDRHHPQHLELRGGDHDGGDRG